MKKLFQTPEVEIISFEIEDVLTISGIITDEDETPVYPGGVN